MTLKDRLANSDVTETTRLLERLKNVKVVVEGAQPETGIYDGHFTLIDDGEQATFYADTLVNVPEEKRNGAIIKGRLDPAVLENAEYLVVGRIYYGHTPERIPGEDNRLTLRTNDGNWDQFDTWGRDSAIIWGCGYGGTSFEDCLTDDARDPRILSLIWDRVIEKYNGLGFSNPEWKKTRTSIHTWTW